MNTKEKNQKKTKRIELPVRYQDFVIKNDNFVGDFEGLYQNIDDPWHQSHYDNIFDSRRVLTINWCNRLRKKYGVKKIIELGCGFGHLTNTLSQNDFEVLGLDISKTAIEKARILNPNSQFIQCALNEFEKIELFDADIYVMAEITWYVLDDLDAFIKNLKNQKKNRTQPIFLIHLLATFAPGIQKYGTNKFTNLNEILNYFNLDYLESGFIKTPKEYDTNSQATYFVAKI